MTENQDKKTGDVRIAAGRSPAYPYIDLEKAVKRAEQVRDAGATRTTLPPETFYKIWGLGAMSSGARQTMAALNHFGLVDYVGRGEDRKVKLSDLAVRIVLDKQPDSSERLTALRVAALSPSIHNELYEKYGAFLPADLVLETHLTRDLGYNAQAAVALISEYKASLAFAGLDKPLNMPDLTEAPKATSPASPESGGKPLIAQEIPSPNQLPTGPLGTLEALGENEIKVMLDGDRLRVSAYVDVRGAKRLLRALKANLALLEDEDEDEDERQEK